jgi:EAL domain-containing protein (putative c-di-GMP-specific phosphodiesterase class I)
MNSRKWPFMAVLALCACVGIGCVAYVLSGGESTYVLILALSSALAVALFSLVGLIAMQANDGDTIRHYIRSEVAGFERKIREERARTDGFSRELIDLREMTNRTSAQIATGFADLREGYSSLAEQLRNTVTAVTRYQASKPVSSFGSTWPRSPSWANSPASVSSAYDDHAGDFAASDYAAPDYASHAAAYTSAAENDTDFHEDEPVTNGSSYTPPHGVQTAAESRAKAVDQLLISLEPVIDLFTSKTAHYRLHLSMSKPEGGEVAHDVLLHHADRTGLRPEFDVFAAREALSLVERLRQRDPSLNIFMQIGASTLQNASALDRIIEERFLHTDNSDGLILELPHSMLAGLSDSGLEGLARLARSGTLLSLSNVAVSGVDIHALSKLNVRFLSLNALAAGGEGPTQDLLDFAQSARAARIQTIVTGIVDRRLVQKLSKLTRFASGPAFAEPRRVKTDAAGAAAGGVGIAA